MSGIPQNWRDLAALIDPTGRCNDPCGENRDLDWYEIYALATSNMVAPTLYSELVKKNCLHLAPTEVQHALRELHHLNKARNSRQQSVLKDTVRILNTRGIEPLLLKGSISLLSETMSEVTDRMMSDIDIALYNAPPERGEEALIQSGYRHAIGQEPAEYHGHHHLAPLFHPSGEGYVEIHRELLVKKIPKSILSLEQVIKDAIFFDWNGLKLWVPSIEHRIMHNVLHHQLQDAASYIDRCSLRQLLEFVQLRDLSAATKMDWREQFKHLDDCGLGEPIRVYLLLIQNLFNQKLPAGVKIDKKCHKAEGRIWYWHNNQRLLKYYLIAKRLMRLPIRLMTPSWYPKKYRQIRNRWM
jgi:hypothetical protein